MVRSSKLSVAASCMLVAVLSTAGVGRAHPSISSAISSARGYLLSTIGPDGKCTGEFAPENSRFAGKTALCVYALLSAGADCRGEPLAGAIEWLVQAELRGTYAVAMRACALAALEGKKPHPQLAKDVKWLISAAGPDGSYTYTSAAGGQTQKGYYDNSNSQMAALGIRAGANRGVKVPRKFWRKIEQHWINQQQVDGGWGYVLQPGARKTQTYGSMTAAGLATMYICFDILHREQYTRPSAPDYRPITDALEWMNKNFAADINPRRGENYYYYWLYSLARVGLASGHKHFGRQDWYARCVGEILERQNGDGSWDNGDRLAQTAFALLFLSQARRPILLNKLSYDGKWNVRPRDAAGFTRYVQHTFEQPVAWQVIDVDSPVDQWMDAPILYISGAGRTEFTDEQIAKMRTFALRGGLVVSESAGNSGSFTMDMRKTYERMFPNLTLRRLPPNHPIYTAYFAPKSVGGLWAISNGVRLLAIHASRELSMALQLGHGESNRAIFELFANIYILTTDKGNLGFRGTSHWPKAKNFTPKCTIRLARVKYKGNYDPEPLAWERFSAVIANRHKIKLQVSEPLEITALDSNIYPVAAMTGTESFELSDAQKRALGKYFETGGTLIIDAAGGSAPFAAAVKKQVLPLVKNGYRSPLARRIAYDGPAKINRVYYRRQLAGALGRDAKDHKLQCVLIAGEKLTGDEPIAIIYSRHDLTAGLLSLQSYTIGGYRPDSAVDIMTNLLFNSSISKLQFPISN